MIKKLRNVALIVLGAAFIMTPSLVFAQSDIIQNGVCSGVGSATGSTTTDCSSTSSAQSSFNTLVTTVINIFSLVVGAVSVIMIIFGGFRYITSAGNDANMASARNTIVYALIGLVIVALAQLIVRFVLAKAIQASGSSSTIFFLR